MLGLQGSSSPHVLLVKHLGLVDTQPCPSPVESPLRQGFFGADRKTQAESLTSHPNFHSQEARLSRRCLKSGQIPEADPLQRSAWLVLETCPHCLKARAPGPGLCHQRICPPHTHTHFLSVPTACVLTAAILRLQPQKGKGFRTACCPECV